MKFDQLRSKYQGYSDAEILAGLQATQYPDYSLEEIKAATGYKPPKRSIFAAANDTVIEAANAAAGFVGSAANFVSPGNRVSGFIDENIIKPGIENQSDAVKAEKARYAQEMNQAQGIGDEVGATLGYFARNPGLGLAQAAGSFAVPGGAVKAGGILAKALGGSAVRGGLAGGAVAGAMGAGGDAAGSAYESVINAGGTEDQATAAARQASAIPAVIGGAGGLVGAEKLLAGAKGFAGGAVSRALKTGAVEAGQEAVEEGFTEFEAQRAALPYDPTIQLGKGVAGAATMGAVLGGATGGGVSLLTQQRAEQGMADLSAAPDVDSAVDAFNRATDVPLMPEQAVAAQAIAPPIAEPSATTAEPDFATRVSTLREQMSDPVTREKMRADGSFDTALQYLNAAATARTPGKTSDRMLAIAEEAVRRATLTPIVEGETLGIEGPESLPQIGMDEAAPQLGYDDRPTGTLRVDPQGQAVPETRAQVVNEQQTLRERVEAMKARRDGMTAQAPKGGEPNSAVMVGEGTLTTAERTAPQPAPTLLLTTDNQPYGSRSAAFVRAKKEGGTVIDVPGGWAVQTQPEQTNEPISDVSAPAAVAVSGADGSSDPAASGIGDMGLPADGAGRSGDATAAPERSSGTARAVGNVGVADEAVSLSRLVLNARAARKKTAALLDVQPSDPDALMSAAEAESAAADAVRDHIAAIPDDGFGLSARTSDGRNLSLTPSAQNPGQWQLTRFDRNGEPWSDSQYTKKTAAIDDFIREADPATLKVEGQAQSRTAPKVDKRSANAKARRAVNVETDTMLQALAKMGGIRRDVMAKEFGARPEELKYTVNVGGLKGFPFRAKGGMSLDGALEALAEAGYFRGIPADEVARAFEDAAFNEMGGSPTLTAEGQMRRAQELANSSIEDRLADDFDPFAPGETINALDDFNADELEESGYADASDEAKALTQALLDEAENLGLDADALREDAARGTTEQTEDFYHARLQAIARQALAQTRQDAASGNASTAARGAEGDGKTAGDEGQRPSLELSAQTAGDLKAKAERAAAAEAADKAEQSRLKRKAEADAQRGEFALTGSDRPADVAVAAGQDGLFDAAPAKQSQPEPEQGDALYSRIPPTADEREMDSGEAERMNRVRNVEEDYRLPNLHNAVPASYVPKEAKQAEVTVYRGVPASLADAKIRPGDWVALSKRYAAQHGTGESGASRIISMKVPADHVAWAGTDMNEFFYVPREEDAGNLNAKAPFAGTKFGTTDPATSDQAMSDAAGVLGFNPGVEVRNVSMPDRLDMPMRYNLSRGVIEYNTAVPRTRAEDAGYMLEELLHAADHIGGNRTISASNDAFLPGGDIRTELENTSSSALRDFFKYPLQEPGYSPTQIAAELFARAGVLYHANPALLKAAAPNTYEIYERTFGPENRPVSLRDKVRQLQRRNGRGQVLPESTTEVRGESRGGERTADRDAGGDRQRQADGLQRLRAAVQRELGGSLDGRSVDFGGGGATLETRSSTPDWIERGPASLKTAASKIDTYAPAKPIAEKVKEMAAGWQDRLIQGMVDAYAPLKKLSMDAYISARMTKAADGAFEGMLMYGKPVMTDEFGLRGDLDGKGFLGIMKDLRGEHDRFFMWMAGNRSKRLLGEGKENLFKPDEIDAMMALNRGTMPDGSSREMAYLKAHKEFQAYSKSVLDIAEKAGLIDGESRKMWEHDFYVPYFRKDASNEIAGPAKIKGLVRQKAFERLKGGKENLGDLMANTLQNWSHLLSASLANVAAQKSLVAAESAGVAIEAKEEVAREMAKSIGKKDGVVYFMDQGRQRWFVVEDPAVLAAVSTLEAPALSGLPLQLMGKFKKYLTLGVTVSPAFKIRNLMRDTLGAPGMNDMSFNIAKNLADGWKGTDTKSDAYAQMLFGGGLMKFGTLLEGDRASHVKRLIDAGTNDKTILNTPQKVKAALGLVWDSWQEFGDRMENVNRAALYQQLIAKGLTTREAAYKARDMMDFSMQGSWAAVRTLTAVVPFLNARMQGLYRLGRAAKEDPKRLGYVVGAVSLASIALMLAYEDDEDWKAREDWDRDAFWWFKVGDTAFRIPKPFEIGAMGTIAERSVELLINDEMTGERFGKRMKEMVFDTFAMNPVPQAFKPMLELYANRDSFTGRQIETLGMERLSKSERASPNTSHFARFIGAAGDYTGVSPVQVDHMVRAYFGWLGVQATTAVDVIASPLSDEVKPASKWTDFSGGFVKELPANQSRYLEQFYDQAKITAEAMADLKHARESGDYEKAQEILDDKGALIAQYRMYQQAQQRISDINKRIRMTRSSANLDAEQKRETIDMLTQARNRIAEAVSIQQRSREAALQ